MSCGLWLYAGEAELEDAWREFEDDGIDGNELLCVGVGLGVV